MYESVYESVYERVCAQEGGGGTEEVALEDQARAGERMVALSLHHFSSQP